MKYLSMFSWLKATVAIYSIACSYAAEEIKCLKIPEFKVQRHFLVNDFDLPLRIEVSSRKSHQLVSHIVKILLNEVIGYPHVHLIHQDKYVGDSALTTFKKISSCKTPSDCRDVSLYGPELMINLEVWLSPENNLDKWVATGEIEDLGPLGPVGRAGWYISEYTVNYFWESNNTVIDHWRAFTNPDVVKHFDLTNNEDYLFGGKNYCTLKECGADGIYRPKQCLSPGVRCATLLADYPASILERTKFEISRLGLLVNIAFVGEQLDVIIEKRTADGRNSLFYHRKPMAVSSMGHFVRVAFPDSREETFSKCGFEVYQLEKVIWSQIRKHAPEAFFVLQSVTFSQSEYTALIRGFLQAKNQGFGVREIACRWLRDNVPVWDKWIPIDRRNKTTLYIGGIFSITGIYWRQRSVYKAARMAADAINSNSSILSNYHLEILSQDGQCSSDEVMRSFINYVTNATYSTMVGILGPACSDTVEPLAGVAKHFNSIIISYSAEGTLFRNREKYPYFFQTIPENNQFRNAYLKLFQRLGYSKVAALTEVGQKHTEYVSGLQDSMQQVQGMSFIVNHKFPRGEMGNITFHLRELKNKGARIIIGDFYDHAARAVMCAAYKLDMTAAHGYIWFLPFWFSSNPWYKRGGGRDEEVGACTPDQIAEAAEGHMSLAHKYYADDDVIMQEGRTVGDWRRSYRNSHSKDAEVSRYGGFTYDAVWVYAAALHALFKENKSHISSLHSEKTSRRFKEFIQQTNFSGVSGPLYFLGSSRLSDVIISQWIDRQYRGIGVYRPTTHSEGELELDERGIVWLTPGGTKPLDGTKELSPCSVELLRSVLSSSCEGAVMVTNGLSLSFFILSMCIVGFIFKLRYDRIIRSKEKRWIELDLMEKRQFATVDEWELPRDHIVINRKLGEGAFGTVYGGEANVSRDGGGWIAVAVKTLKNGAKPEEKLNFLSEAEIMKQLDHINIVKLVGVCTTSEPVYTVMEFMLYGDLKTYLLSRRSIVAKDERVGREEVSDRRLTAMALDIARGLSYLASRRYVHRDLACRNCLVNVYRNVKIADFGMCRATYDSDYYRLNKIGMLPVRWMAPESLIEGLFTPMSDVWSYGVVLYEIVTFASIPYQGLTDSQVLRYIKNFKVMPVPKGIKPQLHTLLHQCWSRSPKHRPPATEIVETLALHPQLISPCLDMPPLTSSTSSSDVFQNHHHRKRGHSLSSVWQNNNNNRNKNSVDMLDPSSKQVSNNSTQQQSNHCILRNEYFSQITFM